jgi:probable HAF family extracellular repeat protein
LEFSRIRRHGLLLGFSAIVLAACGGGEEQTVAQGEVKRPMAAAGGSASSIPFYTVRRIDLGIPWGSVTAKGINAAGQVAGTAPLPPSGISRAFFFDGTTTLDLGTLPGTSSSRGQALNASGQVTGWSESPTKAFFWAGGAMTAIAPAERTISIGQALNDSGLVVGIDNLGAFAWNGSYASYGTTFARFNAVNKSGTIAGALRDGTLQRPAIRLADGNPVLVWPGTESGDARLINDDGLVAGHVNVPFVGTRAFAWKDGVSYPVGNALAASGYPTSTAVDLNQAGQLVGYATSDSAGTAGYVWTQPGGLTFLDNFPGAFPGTLPRAINSNGVVVGAAGSSSVSQRAFIWTAASGIVDLSTRVVNPPAGLFLFDAMAINDSGLIVALANTGLLLLTPASPDTPVPPALGAITASDPVQVNLALNVSVAFSDFNTADTHTAVWSWGDGSTSAGAVTEANGAGSATGSHAYTAAGIYTVTVTVTDSGGQSATVSREVVVFDPNGGSVSGSGWIDSPMGAYRNDFFMAGKADFGFVSKYSKGATVPSGQTMFQFVTAGLRFRSSAYDWLVVAGARAQYKGVGTLNGVDGYRFMLTAIDGDKLARGTPDRFRIRIWHFDEGLGADVVDYDNQVDPDSEGGNDEGTALAGGSIVIQK